MIFKKYPLREVILAVTAMEGKAVIMRCPVTFVVFGPFLWIILTHF
jgi:hypothetical protein